jgi:predicted GNAT superfamily acetyltransferase
MIRNIHEKKWHLRILESSEEMQMVEELQRVVWPGSETDVVPIHILTTAAHNGGLVIGGFVQDKLKGETARLVGFVFGFPGLYSIPDGPRPKHCSHMLAVHPEFRGQGLGFALKRAQWQMVRHQGIDRITWTYDPLLSLNAYLNVARLGAVCSTYLREVYGEMRDGLNIGLPSDRFEVDWWVNTKRVERRLSREARRSLDLAHFMAAGAEVINPTRIDSQGWPLPPESPGFLETQDQVFIDSAILLVEIPADFQTLKENYADLALRWRLHTRALFEYLFRRGYLVTDFVYLPGRYPRSYYVLSHGEGTL